METLNISKNILESGGKVALKYDAEEILHLIDTLRVHHRHARSLNFLGTGLKYIAGTPDADDLNRLQKIQGKLIDNNEKQILINSELQEKINNITYTLNTILADKKKEISSNSNFLELVLHRNRIIINELNNVIHSVSLAKFKVVSPTLLSSNEIQSVIMKESYANISVSDVINDASLKAMQDDQVLYFLIKYPRIDIVCKKLNIFPVIHNNSVINLETNVVGKCRNHYESLKNCRKTTFSFFCEPMEEAKCVKSLFLNATALCGTTTAFHIEPIIEIDEGLVIINNIFAQIRENNGPIFDINGTYLILFEDMVNINGINFSNHKKNSYMSPEVPISQKINFSEHISLLSLPYLNHISSKNLEHIKDINQDLKIQNISTLIMSTLLTVFLIICVAIFIKRIKTKRAKVLRQKQQLENTINMLERAVDSST